MKNESDLLSLLLKSPRVFTEEDMVTSLFDFLIGGVETVQFSAQTLLACVIQKPECLKKLRNEFKLKTDKHAMDSSPCSNTCDFLGRVVAPDIIGDLDYLAWTMKEG